MRRVMSFLTGVVMGSLVGATLALLLAPESGESVRTQIRNRLDTLRNEMEQAARDKRAELEGQLAALRAPQKPEES